MLSEKQKDAITEIVNIGVGKGSAVLSDMIDSEILLNVPYVNVISFDDVLDEFNKLMDADVHVVEINFYGEYEGIATVILPFSSAGLLASKLMNEVSDSKEISQIQDGILTEVGNIILNAVMGSFGNVLEVPIEYRIPQSFEGKVSEIYDQLDREKFSEILICRTNFAIENENISGEILIMYEVNSFKRLRDLLDTLM